jgi:hypothetical protein
MDYGLYDLILADARILWLNIACDKNYNMYKANRTFEIQEEETEGVPWTWVGIIDDLATLAGVTITDDSGRLSGLTSEPRNIMAKGRPVTDVLEEILSFLGLVMIPVMSESLVYDIQRADDYNKDWLTTERKKLVFEGGPVARNDLILPKNIGLRVSSGPDAQIKLVDTAEYNAKGSGSLYLDIKHTAELKDGIIQNTDELEALRGDLIASHSQPNPELMVTLAGIHDLVSDGFTDVEWRSTSEGAFTRGLIRKPKVKATRPEDGLFNYGSFYFGRKGQTGATEEAIYTHKIHFALEGGTENKVLFDWVVPNCFNSRVKIHVVFVECDGDGLPGKHPAYEGYSWCPDDYGTTLYCGEDGHDDWTLVYTSLSVLKTVTNPYTQLFRSEWLFGSNGHAMLHVRINTAGVLEFSYYSTQLYDGHIEGILHFYVEVTPFEAGIDDLEEAGNNEIHESAGDPEWTGEWGDSIWTPGTPPE